MKRFVVAPEAAQDLDDIWSYIAADNLDAADRFLEKLYNQMVALSQTQGMGHRWEDLAEDRDLLFWPVGNYLILYRIIQDRVEVVAVVHGKRDIPTFIKGRGV